MLINPIGSLCSFFFYVCVVCALFYSMNNLAKFLLQAVIYILKISNSVLENSGLVEECKRPCS